MKNYTQRRLEELTGFKTCACCTNTKPVSEFGMLAASRVKKETVQHYKSHCKSCALKQSLNRFYEKRTELQDYQREYARRNREKLNQNPEHRIRGSVYSKRTKEATPKWLSKTDKKLISNMYKLAQKLKEEGSVSFEVDHIVPLNSSFVCGLHVPWNLQLLTAEENNRKTNSIQNDTLRDLYHGYFDFEIDSDLISDLVEFNGNYSKCED